MLTDDEIAAGAARLAGGALTGGDRDDLLSAFRLWLSFRASAFGDMSERLTAARSPVAERLAGALILLKGMNFSVTDLSGGSLGVKSVKAEKRDLIIKYAFGLLYDLPADNQAGLVGSVSVSSEVSW